MSLRQCQPERFCPLTGPAVRCRESSLVMQRWLVVPAIARIMWNLQHLLFLPTHSIIHCAKVFLHTFSKIWRALLLSVNFCVWLREVVKKVVLGQSPNTVLPAEVLTMSCLHCVYNLLMHCCSVRTRLVVFLPISFLQQRYWTSSTQWKVQCAYASRPITECLPILSWFLNGVGKFIGHAANDWWLQLYWWLLLEACAKSTRQGGGLGVYVATYPLPTGQLSLWAFEEHKVWWQVQKWKKWIHAIKGKFFSSISLLTSDLPGR